MVCPPPLVSVIIPSYNQADLLKNALQSVIGQTFKDWEAIVIDNDSVDNTRETAESIGDERIHYARFSNKGVIAASRNRGILLARGRYIAFLDSDDLWDREKLAKCLEFMQKGTAAVCHGLRIRKNGILQKPLIPGKPGENFYETLLYRGNSSIATSTVMIRKKCLEQFGTFSEDTDIITAEDYELWLRLAKMNVRWECIPELLGEYTIHGKNASSNVRKQMFAEEQVVNRYVKKDISPDLSRRIAYRKRMIMSASRAGIRIWRSGNHGEALPFFWKGICRIFIRGCCARG